ncbi:MAG TPA: hypothetical protein VNE63_13830 [Candidatus Acidoferrales bacterium]|nr:hypothetical protein [Candidatus Acidoferrales bacterium]
MYPLDDTEQHPGEGFAELNREVGEQTMSAGGMADSRGQMYRAKRLYACNSALVYSSVIVFGAVRLIDDRALKTWFFERIMAKYGEEGWTFEPGYPQLNRIILYEQKMEIVTGKHSAGLYH